ncbi:MAG TPA: hypothetical protein VJ508_01880 [Saprospiraceae bacterium]|nr:hypothetical protein [Saprospiraceae bacterium]
MKKFGMCMLIVCLMAFSHSVNAVAPNPVDKKEAAAKAATPPPEVQKLLDRIEEIRKMDFSTMTKAEKKELKNELRATKKQLKVVEAVYIPISTAIIVLLILLLIL